MVDAGFTSDVVIAGAGIAGASFALGLKQRAGHLLRVTLCDPDLPRDGCVGPRRSLRAVAVAADSRRHLQSLGVWAEIAANAQPVHSMHITDSRPGALPNPEFLTFDGDVAPGEPFAHMIFAHDLRSALLRHCKAAGVTFVQAGVSGYREERYGLTVEYGRGERGRARLLAAADGGRSRLRHAARIQSVGGDYAQAAIVATVLHDGDHEGRAVQHFLPAGPLAFLPLRDDDGAPKRSSIVWTERASEASRLTALSDVDFVEELQGRAGLMLGAMRLEDRPVAYPLRVRLARRLTGSRLALLGDAARIIHPLAGQGLNLGLRDAASLAGHVAERAALGLDPGGVEPLAAYERDRQFDAAAMAAATDLLNALFSNDRLPLRIIRDFGLSLVDRSERIKSRLIGKASGALPVSHDSPSFSGRSPARASAKATSERRTL